jgi:hypothetical protein
MAGIGLADHSLKPRTGGELFGSMSLCHSDLGFLSGFGVGAVL